MNAEIGKRKYGKIRPGQKWKKRDIGSSMTILGKAGNNCWRVVFDSMSKKASHKIKDQVIYHHYDRLS